MTYEEIIDEVHDEVTISLDGSPDEEYVIIMRGLIKRFENDVDSVEQEMRFHKQIIKESEQ